MTGRLDTTYLGLALRGPIVASPSPLTGELSGMARLEEAGVAAIVLPSLFEEQIERDDLETFERRVTGSYCYAESLDFFPDLGDYNTGPDRYLDLIATAKESLDVPVIASLNATTRGGWVHFASLIEQAGADALELNIYEVAVDPLVSGAELEQRQLALVGAVRDAVSIPLAVKLSPFYSSFAHFAGDVATAGADGLVLFNRFYQPDLDPRSREVRPRLELSSSVELRLPLRWIGVLRSQLQVDLAATTGIHNGLDVAKVLLAGADVAMTASSVLRAGPDQVRRMLEQLQQWMDEEEYESVEQLRGSASRSAVADPSAYERAGYASTLASFRLQRQP